MIQSHSLNCRFYQRCLRGLWHAKMSRIHNVNSHNFFEVTRDKHGLLQRQLDNLERSFALDEPGVVVSSVLISSKVSLEPSLLRNALVLVYKRFPLLRMTIYRDSDNTLWFKEMSGPSKIDFHLCKNYTASEWVKVLESESRVDVDIEKGPLWRVTLLKEEYDNEEQLSYSNSLVMTISHAIYDGVSRLAINYHLLEYLNKLYDGKDVRVESRPLLPPTTHLLRSKLQLSTLEKCIFKVMPVFMSIKSMFVKPTKNVYLEIYPPPILQDPSIVKRTSLVARVIGSKDLLKIAKVGKEHGCTVHSAITAATRLAMAKILKMASPHTSNKDSILLIPLKFSNSFNVAIRKHCQPVIEPNEVGCFISLATTNIETPCYMNITPKAFWEYAHTCKDAVAEMISNGEHYQFLKFICIITPNTYHKMNEIRFTTVESNAGRYDGLFNISNLGRFTIGNDGKDGPFQTKGGYGASAQQRTGHLFSHNLVTINGVLYWGMTYFPHITTKQQAEEFIDVSISILKEGCPL